MIQYKSNLSGVMICGHDTIQIHGFAKKIHGYTIPATLILIQMKILLGQV